MTQFVSIVPVLRVSDLPRSVAWYRDNLGFTAEADDIEASRDSCVMRRDATELMLRRALSPLAKARDSYQWDVYIRLAGEELTALLDHARRRTPLVRGPELMPSGEVEFELEDPDGYRVCVAESLSDTRGFPRSVA